MNKSRLLSAYRVEFRRKGASYQQERGAILWVKKYLDAFSIHHSSQVRHWQCDFYISQLRKEEYREEDLLQAKSAIRFLLVHVLKRANKDAPEPSLHFEREIIQITA